MAPAGGFCRDLLKVQHWPDALDRRFGLGLQDYDSTVGLRSLSVVVDHAALEKALGDLLGAPNAVRPWEMQAVSESRASSPGKW